MRPSIRWWFILALNGMVLAVSLLQGWIAQRVAGRAAEERMLEEMSAGVSRFLAGKFFPLSNTMMGYLREILNEDWVAVSSDGREVIGSSLSPEQTLELRQQFATLGKSGEIMLLGQQYYFDSHQIPASQVADLNDPGIARLFVLIPTAKLQAASNRVSKAVAVSVLPMTLGATAIALMLAFFITNPIRSLAQQMDRLSGLRNAPVADASNADAKLSEEQLRRKLTARGPAEIRQLATSFFSLMDRLDAAMVRLVQSDRLAHLGKICLSVGHELRNPLSGIKMNMRVLRDRIGPKDGDSVETIEREIDRMGVYLGELMSLGSGKPEPRAAWVPVKLSSLAEGVLTIMSGRCRHLAIRIVRQFDDREPEVPGDPVSLRQVIMNLVVNAIDAMPGGGTLTVRSRCAGEGVQFEVQDTGHGVQESGVSIFDAFATSKPEGAGLGLYLSRQVIEAHTGVIAYENTTSGALFRFELPRHAPRDSSSMRQDAKELVV